MRRWRGLKALIHDAVDATTTLIADGHDSAARNVLRVTDHVPSVAAPARAVDDVRRFSTTGVLATVRAVNRAVEVVTDAGLDVAARVSDARDRAPAPDDESMIVMRSDNTRSWAWASDAALGAVNGIIGDRLHARRNGLDLGMILRASGPPSTRVALFVHGLAATEWSWCLEAEAYYGDPSANFGTLLERDLGYTPVFVRYNTGRHVSENGRRLADALDRFVASAPTPIEEIVLVGHSLGGLVARSACHYASEARLPWVDRVRRVFCLGSPHRGAPLEKLGFLVANVLGAIDLPGTRIPARILEQRSAGIQDLRHGRLVDEDWLDRDPDVRESDLREVPLLAHASYHFVYATVTTDASHPVGRIVGDLLVRVPSASGPAVREHRVPIETAHLGGVLHHRLQSHPAVYEQIRCACAGEKSAEKLTDRDDRAS